MSRQTLILAKNITEANRYAKLIGLERFTYRPVRSAGSIRGVRNAEIHILPSFLGRLDRHAILAALAWAKSEVYYVDPADFADPQDPNREPTNPDAPAGPTEREIEVAYRYNRLISEPQFRVVAVPETVDPPQSHVDLVARVKIEESDVPSGEAEQGEDPAPVVEPKPAPKPRKPRTPKPPAAPAADFF